MTIGLTLFAVGAAVFLLLAYGLLRDYQRARHLRVIERAEPVDLEAERHKVFPLPRQYPGERDEAA